MAELFYTILTNTGKAKWAAAIANGTTVNLEEMALGSGLNDAYYNPVESQLTLKTEVWRGQLSSLSVDIENPNWIVLEGVVLATVGGFNVREVGIFDTAGDMIAIGKFPETYKPSYADGSTKDLWVKVYLEVSNTSVVTLAIDPAVAVPTVQTVNNAVAVHNAVAASENTAGHVQMATQAETTAGVVTNKAVVPATLKVVTDAKQPLDATLTAMAALATAADKLIYATGSDTFATTTLTAFARTLLDDADAATARATLGVLAGTESASGLLELATSAETVTGTDAVRATHAAGVKAAIDAAITALVNGSPAALNQLNELATALGNDPNFATTITTALAAKQPLDATLTAMAALATAADKLIYATGSDTFATTTLTAFARTLLDDADAATARATLGLGAAALLAVGTSSGTVAAGDHNHGSTYQPLDATLTAMAALATAADKLIYATGSDTFATTTLTAFARTLLDDADAAAARATLGLGAAALLTVGTAAGTVAAGDASIGYSQSWTNVTASRAVGTTYYNTTGKPIMITIRNSYSSGVGPTLTVGGVVCGNASAASANAAMIPLTSMVPPGMSYSVTGAFDVWYELR